MDADKQDGDLPEGGAGDYLVWYEATRYAKDQDRDLLIVTRDQKQDWRCGARKRTSSGLVLS